MQLKDINFPEALISAQRSGRLVVFAGAGVSMSPPSSLPNFELLADKIAAGHLKREDKEPIDRFLGRLEKKGVEIRKITQSILCKENSKPNPVHDAILTLFPSTGAIRVVTTNFDRHFSTAALKLFQESLDTFYAPALPIGSEFEGLVYLHGSVDKKLRDIVLTDSDFGRAYLTDGWATRFLKEMFLEYTVLFMGYSLQDPVMQYLARGLPPSDHQPRYALTKPEKNEHWEHLGITQIIYPLREDPNKHSALLDGMSAWGDYARMGSLDYSLREGSGRRVKKTPSLGSPG